MSLIKNLFGSRAKPEPIVIQESLPDMNREWYFEVMLPPFAENLTVLFRGQTEV